MGKLAAQEKREWNWERHSLLKPAVQICPTMLVVGLSIPLLFSHSLVSGWCTLIHRGRTQDLKDK